MRRRRDARELRWRDGAAIVLMIAGLSMTLVAQAVPGSTSALRDALALIATKVAANDAMASWIRRGGRGGEG